MTALAAITVFCTTYALILPAITMMDDDCVICGMTAHRHDESCYTYDATLDYAGLWEQHRHTADCFDENGACVCGYADYFIHTHDDTCYDEFGNLICPLPQISEHSHTYNCISREYELVCGLPEGDPLHVHDESCYIYPEDDFEPELVCGLSDEPHFHTDGCTALIERTVCGCSEPMYHRHEASCFTEDGILICGMEEVFEAAYHRHGPECFRDGELVCGEVQILRYQGSERFILESARTLICTLPEHEHDMGCFPPSMQQPAEPEPTWLCGHAYEHFHDESCYMEGDLICTLLEHVHDGSCLFPPHREEEAAEPAADECEYICGFAFEHIHGEGCYYDGHLDCALPEHVHTAECLPTAEIFESTIRSHPASDGAVAVITGVLSEDAECLIDTVTLTEEEFAAYLGETQAENIQSVAAYDIRIISAGEEWQPEGPVSVRVLHPDVEASPTLEAAHVDSVTDEVSMMVEAVYENGGISFEAEGFSTYIFFTVDFSYEGYEYSMEGMDSMLLSELFSVLGIERAVTEVTAVSFSDPSLLEITALEGDWQLTSLSPFETNETLTVTFADGETISIDVTDAITTDYAWERVSTIDDTSAYYLIVTADDASVMAFDWSWEWGWSWDISDHIDYSPNTYRISIIPEPGFTVYTTSTTVGDGGLWRFSSTGLSSQQTNAGSRLSAGLRLNETGKETLIDITKTTNTLTYYPNTQQFTISNNGIYLQFEDGAFTRTDDPNAQGTRFYIYKRVPAMTSYSNNAYTIPVFMVRFNQVGSESMVEPYGTVTIDYSHYTSSNPFNPSSFFYSSEYGDGTFLKAYYGNGEVIDQDDVTGLYINRTGSGWLFDPYHYVLNVKTKTNPSGRQLLYEAGSDNALFIMYENFEEEPPQEPLPATGGMGRLPITLAGLVLPSSPVWCVIVKKKKKNVGV